MLHDNPLIKGLSDHAFPVFNHDLTWGGCHGQEGVQVFNAICFTCKWGLALVVQVHCIVKLLFHQSPTRHSDYTVTDSESVVTVNNYRQHGDRAANDSVVTMLPAVVNGDYTVTVQSTCSHCV